MVENGVLQFSFVHQIIQKKFAKLISSLDEALLSKSDDLGYGNFLASCLVELYEYDLESQYYTFTVNPKIGGVSEEERDIYDLCTEVNKIVFEKLLVSMRPQPIAKTAEYLLDQGLRALVAFEVHADKSLKDKNKIEAQIESNFKQRQ